MGTLESGFVPGGLELRTENEKMTDPDHGRMCLPDWLVLQAPRVSVPVLDVLQRFNCGRGFQRGKAPTSHWENANQRLIRV